MRASYDAIVLAGGRGSRLGEVDKAALDMGGRPLLERSLDVVADAGSIVIAGDARPVSRPVRWVREQPPGGGPAAGVAAALRYLSADVVVVLACDMPLLRPNAAARLVRAVGDGDGAVLVGPDGHRQPLAAAYRTEALRAAVERAGAGSGTSMRRLIAALTLADVPASETEVLDCDDWGDVARSRRLVEDR